MKQIGLRLFTNWNTMRVIRLGLGLFILIEGIGQASGLSLALGSILTFSGLFNVGGCAGGNCAVPFNKTHGTNTEDVVYEEVSEKK